MNEAPRSPVSGGLDASSKGRKACRRRLREQIGQEDIWRTIDTDSMWPTVRVGDSIRFRRCRRPPRIGEIWVFERAGRHIAHRVLWRFPDGGVLAKGDNRLWADVRVAPEALFGPVLEVERAGQHFFLQGRRARWGGVARGITRSFWLALRRMARRH